MRGARRRRSQEPTGEKKAPGSWLLLVGVAAFAGSAALLAPLWALPYVPAERLVLAPDCGMKYLPRESASGKLRSLTLAAEALRAELGA